MPSVWLALLLLATSEAVEPPPRGRLCAGDGKTSLTEGHCFDTTTATIAVKPVEAERRFYWLSADAKTAYAGVIAPKAESVVLDPKTFSALDTTLDGDVMRGWPLDLTISLAVAPKQGWTWTLDRDEAKRLRRLYVPRGKYRLTANAEHHRTYHMRVVAGAEPSKLDVHLVPLPVARGVVVDAEDKPIAEASIALPDETLCTTANEQGAFTCELPERLPEALVVSRSRYAPRELAIARETAGQLIDFGRVRLSAGHLLTLKIVRPEPSPARVSLFLRTRYRPSKLKTISIEEREETVRFDAAEGQYLVLVGGDGPLERYEAPVEMKDADTEHEIRIAPFQLAGSVRFGEDLLAEGFIEIVARDNTWRSGLPVTGGAFGATMWQSGVLDAWVSASGLAGWNESIASPELGEDPSKWDIRIEKRMIVGRVFDASTKAPVTEAGLDVVFDGGNSKSSFIVNVQPDSSYQILAHSIGTYTIRVGSRHYMSYTAELRITAEDGIRTHDIALERGILQPIDVVTPGGVGLSLVSVLEGVQPDGVNPERMSSTDERGHYELRGVAGQSHLLYFVPREGSLAVARVTVPRTSAEAKPLQVVVPAPSCALRVNSVDSDGKPVPAGVLIRYNGDFVPWAILRFVTGFDIRTGPWRAASSAPAPGCLRALGSYRRGGRRSADGLGRKFAAARAGGTFQRGAGGYGRGQPLRREGRE